MIGSWYFLAFRHDFEYTTAYQMLQRRNLKKILASENFSLEKYEALEKHVSDLERELSAIMGDLKP